LSAEGVLFRCLLLFLLLATGAQSRPLISLADLQRQSQTSHLETVATYLRSVRAAKAIFLKQGGIVEPNPALPTVILPDLHAQRDYLLQVLEMRVNGDTVYDQLARGRINLLCLGDGMHSEQRNLKRWLQAEQDYSSGFPSPALEAELVESLGLLKMVMDLKVSFPSQFFFVRGNHEDMDPARPSGS